MTHEDLSREILKDKGGRMNKKFEEFIDETKQRLLAYEMDESCFDDYDDEDRKMMKRLREALYGI